MNPCRPLRLFDNTEDRRLFGDLEALQQHRRTAEEQAEEEELEMWRAWHAHLLRAAPRRHAVYGHPRGDTRRAQSRLAELELWRTWRQQGWRWNVATRVWEHPVYGTWVFSEEVSPAFGRRSTGSRPY